MRILRLVLLVTAFCCLILLSSTYFALPKPSRSYPASSEQNSHQMDDPRAISSSSESYVFINVSDYSGTTDTERIQNALNDVPEEGAIVFVPEGVWTASNLTAKSRTDLLGENGTVIKRPNSTTSPFITFRNQSAFSITNLTFDGQNISQATGVLMLNCTRFKILNNTFIDISRNAVRVSGISQSFGIEKNVFIRCDDASVILFGSPSERYIRAFTIADNLLISGKDNGKIGVAFAANGTIANNTVINCEYGIATRCVSFLAIKNNHVENCSRYAFYLGTQTADSGSDNIEIAHNYAVNSSIGISRYYGSQLVQNVTLKENLFLYNDELDVEANFPATFVNNTLTSDEKLRILNTDVQFIENRDVEGQPIFPGDINDDLRIDMKDIGGVARIFGSTSSDGIWNPSVDIIEDEVIDMKDIGFVAKQFGHIYT